MKIKFNNFCNYGLNKKYEYKSKLFYECYYK